MSDRTFYASTFVQADGVTRTWPFSFAGVNGDRASGTTPYLHPDDVKVQELFVDSAGVQQTLTRTGVLESPNQITIDGPPVELGREIRIYRETELRYPLVDYRDLQSVSEHDLDLANRQAIFVTQETRDGASANLLYDTHGNFNAKMRRIINVAPGIGGNDAVNMNQWKQTLRAPELAGLRELPPAAERARKLVAFDDSGNATVVGPASGSAVELAMSLSRGETPIGIKQEKGHLRELNTAYKDVLDIADYVQYGDGRDESDAIELAFAEAKRLGRVLFGRPGFTVGISRTLTIDCNVQYLGLHMAIKPVPTFTSGVAIHINGTTETHGTAGKISGLRSRVAIGSVGNMVGVRYGDMTGSVNNAENYDWDISGYSTNLRFFGNNVYIINFTGCSFLSATSRNISWECKVNSGESIRFTGGTISSAHNSLMTSVGIFIDPLAAAPDLRVHNLSMAYNDWNLDIGTGIFEAHGVHEENNHNNPFWRVRNTGGGAEKTVTLKVGGTMTGGPLGSAPPEAAVGRDCYVLYDGATAVEFVGVRIGTYKGADRVADYVTKLAKRSTVEGNSPAYKLKFDVFLDANRTSAIPMDICPALNVVWLAGPQAFDGFILNTAGGISYIPSNKPQGEDTRSRTIKAEGDTPVSGSYNSIHRCTAGQQIVAKVNVSVAATVAKQVGARLIFQTDNGMDVGTYDFARQLYGAAPVTNTVQFISMVVPQGAQKVVMQMRAGEFLGEATFTNERMWIM